MKRTDKQQAEDALREKITHEAKKAHIRRLWDEAIENMIGLMEDADEW